MDKKKKYKLTIILSVILGCIAVIALYANNIKAITEGYNQTEGMNFVVLVISIRICVLTCMAYYVFHRWFQQEKQYFSDLPFLFGFFFTVLIFGKALDLFWDLTYYSFGNEYVLFLLKIRYFVAILTLLPMMYLSIGMILYSLSLKDKHEKLRVEKHGNKVRIKILIIIILIEMIAVILAPDPFTLGRLLPIFVIPSVATVVWLFIFAYKNKRLSQVHTKILAIGFGVLLASNLFRPLVLLYVGAGISYIVLVESVDLIVHIVIFIGFYMKIDYAIN